MDEEMPGSVQEKTCAHEGECNCESPMNEESAPKGGEREEIALAFLLALMPLVVLTFFGQVGLI